MRSCVRPLRRPLRPFDHARFRYGSDGCGGGVRSCVRPLRRPLRPFDHARFRYGSDGCGGGVRSCVRPLRRPLRPFDHARFRYVSDGQGAAERRPLASPRSRGASPPLDPQRILHRIPSPPASLRRRTPSGDLATGTRCARISRSLHFTGVLIPTPSLRRMCRRQGPASHASTHVTFPLNNIQLYAVGLALPVKQDVKPFRQGAACTRIAPAADDPRRRFCDV